MRSSVQRQTSAPGALAFGSVCSQVGQETGKTGGRCCSLPRGLDVG